MYELDDAANEDARRRLRMRLIARGKGNVDVIAMHMRKEWGYGHLLSYRYALGLTQVEACDLINATIGALGGDDGGIGRSLIGKFEAWPDGKNARKPPVSKLVAMAEAYGTHPLRLVDSADLEFYTAAERMTLHSYRRGPVTGGTDLEPFTRMMEARRPRADEPPQPPPQIPWVPPGRPGSAKHGRAIGDPREREVMMAAEEAAQRQDNFANVGEATVEYFRGETIRLSRLFPTAAKLELFGSVKMLFDRLMVYVDDHQRASQARDMSFLAGAACGMLAEVTDNLGYFDAATAHIRLGLLYANEAGSDALKAWLIGEHALIACHQGLPKRARSFAYEAARVNSSGRGSVNAWVRMLAARGSAMLGDEQEAQDNLGKANEARERHTPDDLDEFGGILSFKAPKQHYMSTHVNLILDKPDPVVAAAEATVEEYEVLPTEDRALDNIAQSHLHAATAHVMNDDVEAAKDAIQPALKLRTDLKTAGMDQSYQRLHKSLRTPRYRESSTAVEVRDQIEDVLLFRPTLP